MYNIATEIIVNPKTDIDAISNAFAFGDL